MSSQGHDAANVRRYDQRKIAKRLLLTRLDEIRAKLNEEAMLVAGRDAWQLLLDARNAIAQAQDLIEADERAVQR